MRAGIGGYTAKWGCNTPPRQCQENSLGGQFLGNCQSLIYQQN